MMPIYTNINLDYPDFVGGRQVFVFEKQGFPASFGKITPAADRDRQNFFHNLLRRIEAELGTGDIPVFIEWNNGRRRMDKGCVGHALAAGFIHPPVVGDDGEVAFIRIKYASDQ